MRCKNLARFFLDVLFPPRCMFCGKTVSPGTRICSRCARGIVPAHTVRRMNIPAAGKTVSCAFVYDYAGPVRQSVIRFKFYGRRQYAEFFADRMAEQILKQFSGLPVDTVTAVPISAERKKTRGYNQSELIARRLAEKLERPYADLLVKRQDNPEQHTLSRSGRYSNVRGVYLAEKAAVSGKHVLLVDDIVTTGATLSECARVLFAAGAVSVLCAATAGVPDESVEII